jgi:hypothetical protein
MTTKNLHKNLQRLDEDKVILKLWNLEESSSSSDDDDE